MSSYNIIGLMSGTSLDGLDISYATYQLSTEKSDDFELHAFETYPYPKEISDELIAVEGFNPVSLAMLDKQIGAFYASCVNQFCTKNQIDKAKVDAIACHGQTLYHQPYNGFTVQIGCGDTLAYRTDIKVINDFRTKDVIAGGQGAPLVPKGDFGLFHDKAEAFLNIGGFCNASWMSDGEISAFDICPGNLPLNKLAQNKGLVYDRNGELAASGTINFFLLDLLNSLDFYTEKGPKSLGTEWLETVFYPLIKFDREIENNLRTLCEHYAIQLSAVLNNAGKKSVLVTGGGAKNAFLISRLSHYFDGELILPSEELIDSKEALIFGYLGALYLDGKTNNVPSVTGAERAVRGGVLHIP
jgi:anhydro-N-acetylmuramic acid kinase